ncbi:MAG: alanine:cation symporter family protein, partial [Neisseriaceae bacterium]|nr:alanine:cation symporter family protein [Neisseriaceae bacterium]
QGIVQMMGVFVDTILICSSTAFIVLLADVSPDLGLKGVALTQKAMEITMGPWAVNFLAVAVFLFAFTSVIGNYAYAEGNLEFINKKPGALFIFRLTVLIMVMMGALIEVPIVWDMADLAMGIMALINLGAIILLSKTLFLVLKDYELQRRAKITKPLFKVQEYPDLAKKLEHDVWQ